MTQFVLVFRGSKGVSVCALCISVFMLCMCVYVCVRDLTIIPHIVCGSKPRPVTSVLIFVCCTVVECIQPSMLHPN